jgi:transposase
MNSEQLFTIALGLTPPWKVDYIEFKATKKKWSQLHIYLSYPKGSKFKDANGNDCAIHDTKEKVWRHLDFFQHECYLHAKVPRIRTSDGNVHQVQVPWARPNSGFTLLFEAFAMSLIEHEMPVNKASHIMRVYPHRLWNVFKYWVNRALKKDCQANVKQVGIDETSARKGHDYVTLAADIKAKRVIFVTPGKDETCIKDLKEHLKNKGVQPEQIEQATIDMSPAFISGLTKHFPTTQIICDRFHIVKQLNEAMDAVRKAERRKHDDLKGHKYTFLKKNKNLTEKQRIAKYEFIEDYPVLGEAVRLQELFNDLWDFRDREQAEAFLAYWCDLVDESDIAPFKKFVTTIKNHWYGIANYAESQITNGILEGINNKIQLAKRRARGYRNINNFIAMIHFICGKLDFDYPHVLT